MRITKKKLAAVVAGTAVVALGTTAAFAYFLGSQGSGQNTGVVGTATAWQVDVDAAVPDPEGSSLLPGAGSLVAHYTVRNVGASGQYLGSVVAVINSTGGMVNDAPGCDVTWFNVATSGLPAGVVASGGTNPGTVTITMPVPVPNVDQSACAGHGLPFTVTAT